MKNSKFSIKYRYNGAVYTDDLYQTSHYIIENDVSENRLKMTIVPTAELELISVSLTYNYGYKAASRFFANGYQSWTETREYRKQDRMRGTTPLVKLLPFLKPLVDTSGDYAFKKYPKKAGVFHGYTYAYIREGEKVELFGSMTERQGFTIFNADMNADTLTIEKDTEGLIVNGKYELFNITRYEGGYDSVFENYFSDLGLSKPRIEHLSGYTSWYNYFQKINEEIILRDLSGTDRVRDSVSIFQIDDGYAPFVGDWLDKNERDFPNGMKNIADKIHEKGYLAGIWLAPFNVQRVSKTATEHPEWLIKKPNGKPKLGCVGWGGAYTLNIEIPEVREHIKNFFSVILNEWGYDMVKLDFLYSQCMLPRNGKTRGRIMTEAMEFLRECVGDKLILGCGVPLGPSFGLVDAVRVSCDVSLTYKDRIHDKLHINREIPSAKNAMVSSIFRRHLNHRAFINDPDVFFLRDFNLNFTKEQKLLLAKINNLFGSVLFVSDDIGKYGEAEAEILKNTFKPTDKEIISAEFTDGDNIKIVTSKDGKTESFQFNLKTGL